MAVKLLNFDPEVIHCGKQYVDEDKAIEIFFPEGKDAVDKTMEAKALCAGCPMLIECFQFAVENKEEWGIWGGATAKERAYLMRRPRDRRLFLLRMLSGEIPRVITLKDENTIL